MSEGTMKSWGASATAIGMRRRSDDEEEFGDGFQFEEEEEYGEDLDEEEMEDGELDDEEFEDEDYDDLDDDFDDDGEPRRTGRPRREAW
jgi:hypothetical protein